MSKFSCKLNENFTDALVEHKVAMESRRFPDGTTGDVPRLVCKKTNNTVFFLKYLEIGEPMCCGITELHFAPLFQYGVLNKRVWDETIAKYIHYSIDTHDARIVFVGIPTKVGAHSQYHQYNYNKLRKTLKKFGFKETSMKPYKNQNSGNDLIVLIGQMPV